MLRIGLGGLDVFLGVGGLGAVFATGLLGACSGWRSVGCFELCLRGCTQGSPHGALLHLMVASAALDYPSLLACTTCLELRSYVLGETWSPGEVEERVARIHEEAEKRFLAKPSDGYNIPDKVFCYILEGRIRDLRVPIPEPCRSPGPAWSKVLPRHLEWPLLGTAPPWPLGSP